MASILKTFTSFFLVLAFHSGVFATFFYSEGSRTGSRIKWKDDAIELSISSSLLKESSNIKVGSDVSGAIERSIATWERAIGITFLLYETSLQNASPAGPAGDGISLLTAAPSTENLHIFGSNTGETPAATRVFFDGKGNITEADIVLNPLFQFSTDGTFGTYDLESVLVHEIGHLLGLEHIPTPGSVMSGYLPRNGLYGVSHFELRRLSHSDLSLARSLYGPYDLEARCCSEITGRIDKKSRGLAGYVWIENAENGIVAGAAEVASDGSFEIGGLEPGLYSAYWHHLSKSGTSSSHQWIDTFLLEEGENHDISFEHVPSLSETTVEYIGLIGQLSQVSLPLNRSRTFTVYLGGNGLDANGKSFHSTSPFLDISANSMVVYENRDNFKIISIEISVLPDAPIGAYSLFLKDMHGQRIFLPGAITVTEHANPWLKHDTVLR